MQKLVLSLCCILLFLVSPNLQEGDFIVDWDPIAVNVSLETEGTEAVNATFTSPVPLRYAYLYVTPNLRQFISTTPSSYQRVSPGTPYGFTINIDIPPDTQLGTYTGRIHLVGYGVGPSQPMSVVINVVEPPTGTMVESTFADAQILNPILSVDSASSDVNNKLFLGLLNIDAFSGEIVGEIADRWFVSEDGLTYTFVLRRDVFWTDGMPVTANDVKFTYDAIASDLVDSPRKSNIALVQSIDVINPYTLEVVFSSIDCTALQNFTLGILPAHMYAEDFSDVMENPLNEAPSVTNGPFKFHEWVKGEYISLVRNESYYLGTPALAGWIYKVYPDSDAELAAFLNGDIDLFSAAPDQISTIMDEIAAGGPYAIETYPSDGYNYIGLNMGNPSSPEIGWEDLNGNGEFDNGEPPNLDQSKHPVLGDKSVRQAIAYAIDYDQLQEDLALGPVERMASNVLPTIEWAYNTDLEPYPFDTAMAISLLNDAGWTDTDGDGIRDKEGNPLELSIMTNMGNVTREEIVQMIAEDLNAIGFDITVDIIDFGSLVGSLVGQEYDMVVLGWINMGSDPDDASLWAYRYDKPGSGFNFVSYYNETVDNLLFEAKSVPGCSIVDRGELYKEIQVQIHEDVPYAFLFTSLGNVVWNTRLQGVDPGPWSTYHNVHEWYTSTP